MATGILLVAPGPSGFSSAVAAVDGPAIQGTVTLNGAPIEADVVVVAWPDQEVLDSLVEGDQVPQVSLGSAVADSTGTYKVALDPAVIPADYISDSGQVDIEVRAANATIEASWAISLKNVGGVWINAADYNGVSIGTAPPSPAPTVSIDLGSGLVTDSSIDLSGVEDASGEDVPQEDVPVEDVPVQVEPLTAGLTERSELFDSVFQQQQGTGGNIPLPCGQQLLDITTGHKEWFARAQGTANMVAKSVESSGTSHSMGVAANINGVWQQDGTRTIERGSSGGQSTRYSRLVGNTVNYGHYMNSCTPTRQYYSRPHSIHSLNTQSKYVARKSFAYCMATPSTYEWTKNETTNSVISAGVAVRGIGLTVRSGWNNQTRLEFTADGPAKMCYTSRLGPEQSKNLGANAR